MIDFFFCLSLSSGLAKRVGARLLLASTSEVYGGMVVSLNNESIILSIAHVKTIKIK